MRPARTPAPMRRRDLLLLRPTPRDRVFDLPCQRLYMRYLDARSVRPEPQRRDEGALGEPDPVYDVRDARELFDALARELADADVLRILNREWLADPGLRQEVDRLIAAFAARGGRVEFGSG